MFAERPSDTLPTPHTVAAMNTSPQQSLIATACSAIETSEAELSLAELAGIVGLSPHYFQRVFKAAVGVSPKAYRKAVLAKRAEASLATSARVTDAIYAAGFNSTAGFYESHAARAGMTARARAKGGAGEAIRYALETCALGMILIAATERGVCAIEFGDSAQALERRLRARFPKADFSPADVAFARWIKQILAYIEEPKGALALPLDIRGTAFQTRVWQALRDIPPGEKRSYTDIAHTIGQPKAVRAVASACAHNEIAVAIPCHRVVKSDGALAGYRWGVARKAALLAREESANAAGISNPTNPKGRKVRA
jgi:AraC family transcriptional regulator of adaptative response/methylated-DNA-[protein]-cysteine methyltransferase